MRQFAVIAAIAVLAAGAIRVQPTAQKSEVLRAPHSHMRLSGSGTGNGWTPEAGRSPRSWSRDSSVITHLHSRFVARAIRDFPRWN
jgi:hypothetical protein